MMRAARVLPCQGEADTQFLTSVFLREGISRAASQPHSTCAKDDDAESCETHLGARERAPVDRHCVPDRRTCVLALGAFRGWHRGNRAPRQGVVRGACAHRPPRGVAHPARRDARALRHRSRGHAGHRGGRCCSASHSPVSSSCSCRRAARRWSTTPRGAPPRAIRELEAAAPRTAHRLENGSVADIPVEKVDVGDLLLVRPGELVPCDAVVTDGHSLVDASRLTGEPVPVEAEQGVTLHERQRERRRCAHHSCHRPRQRESVRAHRRPRAPRAERASRPCSDWPTGTPCGSRRSRSRCARLAYLTTGDWVRVLAVLVVATPCPLILATPIAIIGGINAAATADGDCAQRRRAGAVEPREHRRVRQDGHAHRRPTRSESRGAGAGR